MKKELSFLGNSITIVVNVSKQFPATSSELGAVKSRGSTHVNKTITNKRFTVCPIFSLAINDKVLHML